MAESVAMVPLEDAAQVENAEMDRSTRPGISVPILATLGLLAVNVAVATDFYLAAFPLMVKELSTSAAGIQLTLTAIFVGGALGQLVFGPVSDLYGRFRPLMVGSVLCMLAGAAAAASPNVASLIATRFVQGFGGAAGMVIGRAIVSDFARDRKEAAHAFSILISILCVVPVVAPWLGSVLLAPIGWRGMLWGLCGISVGTLLAVFFFLKKPLSQQHTARCATEASNGSTFKELLSIGYIGNTCAFGLGFAVQMSYISASPFLFQVVMGLSVKQYGRLFASIAIVSVIFSVIAAQLAKKIHADRLVHVSLPVLVASCLAVAAVVFLNISPLWAVVPLAVAVGCCGFALGNITSLAFAKVPNTAGAGSAILGAIQFLAGAVASPLVGLRGEGSATPLALVMSISAMLAYAAFLTADRKA